MITVESIAHFIISGTLCKLYKYDLFYNYFIMGEGKVMDISNHINYTPI